MSTPAQPYYPQVDKSVDPKVTVHIQRIYPWLNNLDKAIIGINTKVVTLQKTAAAATTTTTSTTSSSSSSSGGSSTNNFTGLGTVNDQTGNTAYTIQQTDSGAEIQVADASPIAISLNSVITSPFFAVISNLGTSTVTLTPTSGTVNGASTFTLLKNSMSWVVFSGGKWYASAIPIVPLNTPAVVHQWLDSYDDTTGLFTQTRPTLSDITGAPLSGVSGSLGGSAMTAGQTITIAVTIAGAAVGMVAATSPETYPGDGFVWDAYISAVNTVTVRLTAVLAATPTASMYDIRVIQ
jgi:hypothetical protein